MSNSTLVENSQPEEPNYRHILTAIVQRFIRLTGVAGALKVARRVPGLVVDDQGTVVDYDHGDPIGAMTMLVEEYRVVFGERAVAISREATRRAGNPLADSASSALADAASAAPLRILLVDDHVLFRHGLVRLLDPQPDFKIAGEAGTVQEAIALTRELKPDLVLMDISLPDGTGLDATHAIIAQPPAPKIVFLTVHEEDETLFAAIRAGGVGYLPKSVGTTELISRLRSVGRGEAAISPQIARRILQEFSRLSDQAEPQVDELIALTAREIEILRALARGATNRQIADQLVISEHTVKNHVKRILAKLHLHSRRDAASYARRRGLVPPSFDSSP